MGYTLVASCRVKDSRKLEQGAFHDTDRDFGRWRIAGHTAALHPGRMLDNEHEIVVVAPNSRWNWIPSNIWVVVGHMSVQQVTFPLAPVYKRKGIEFHQALGTELHPEGGPTLTRPHVTVKYTDPIKKGKSRPRIRLPHQRDRT